MSNEQAFKLLLNAYCAVSDALYDENGNKRDYSNISIEDFNYKSCAALLSDTLTNLITIAQGLANNNP